MLKFLQSCRVSRTPNYAIQCLGCIYASAQRRVLQPENRDLLHKTRRIPLHNGLWESRSFTAVFMGQASSLKSVAQKEGHWPGFSAVGARLTMGGLVGPGMSVFHRFGKAGFLTLGYLASGVLAIALRSMGWR